MDDTGLEPVPFSAGETAVPFQSGAESGAVGARDGRFDAPAGRLIEAVRLAVRLLGEAVGADAAEGQRIRQAQGALLSALGDVEGERPAE